MPKVKISHQLKYSLQFYYELYVDRLVRLDYKKEDNFAK